MGRTGQNNNDMNQNSSDVDYTRSKSKRKQDDSKMVLEVKIISLNLLLPSTLDEEFATALFEFGLKQSSPKILISLMPQFPGLNTEHIKSHLQKYRIHHDRSKVEFSEYYRENFHESFSSWMLSRGWESHEFSSQKQSLSLHNSATTPTSSSSSSRIPRPIRWSSGSNTSLNGPSNHSSRTSDMGIAEMYQSDMKRSRIGSSPSYNNINNNSNSYNQGQGYNQNHRDVINEAEEIFQDWGKIYNDTLGKYEKLLKVITEESNTSAHTSTSAQDDMDQDTQLIPSSKLYHPSLPIPIDDNLVSRENLHRSRSIDQSTSDEGDPSPRETNSLFNSLGKYNNNNNDNNSDNNSSNNNSNSIDDHSASFISLNTSQSNHPSHIQSMASNYITKSMNEERLSYLYMIKSHEDISPMTQNESSRELNDKVIALPPPASLEEVHLNSPSFDTV